LEGVGKILSLKKVSEILIILFKASKKLCFNLAYNIEACGTVFQCNLQEGRGYYYEDLCKLPKRLYLRKKRSLIKLTMCKGTLGFM